MESKFASSYKASFDEVKKDLDEILNAANIKKVIDALPFIAAVLNENRQIVYANKALLKQLNLDIVEQVISNRPGEALYCSNSKKEIGGCGTSENCKYCGAVNTILQCQENSLVYSDECRIISEQKGIFEAFDFRVTSAPFQLDNRKFVLFTLLDISSEKRKLALEKIFFHDIINKAGSLQGFIELMKNLEDQDQLKEFVGIIDEISIELTQEIITQRELVAAENGELKVKLKETDTAQIVQSSVNQILKHEVILNRSITIDSNIVSVMIRTDPVLLKRILINMLKNALEASTYNGNVNVGCFKDTESITFYVKNNTYMPRKIQLQVFQRSFSTKGKDRGLGTYSMKLLGERYLKGKVFFETSEDDGTKFYIRLPIEY